MQLNQFSTPQKVFIVHLLIYSTDFSKTNCTTKFWVSDEVHTHLTLYAQHNMVYIGKAFMHSSPQLEFLE